MFMLISDGKKNLYLELLYQEAEHLDHNRPHFDLQNGKTHHEI